MSAPNTDGTISARSMVVALAKNGVPLEIMKLYKEMTDEERAEVRAALA